MTTSGIVEWILSLHGFAALAVVFLGPALEASAFVGFVIPGEVAVLLGGLLAHQGRIPLWGAIVAGALGAIVGDSVGYWVGRESGRRILTTVGRRLPFLGHRVEEHFDGAEAFVRRHGASAVFLGRFTTALRVMVPGLAGISRIAYGRFLLFNVLGGVVWAAGFVLLGFFAGAAWQRVASIASRVGLVLFALVLLVLLAGRVLRIWQRTEATDRGPISGARRRWPRQVRWIERRFEPSVATGFPLSVAVVGGAVCAWAFVAITQDVVGNEEAARHDKAILRFALEHRTAA